MQLALLKECTLLVNQKNTAPPLPYFSNQKAWMTTNLWHEILHSLDSELQKENRNIFFFVDNASCHTNIKIQFIPPNTTALIQPLDQGIISAFKSYYRQIIVKKQISALEREMSIRDFYKSISYLDALYFTKRAWWLVTPSCISNCFKKAGFTINTPECDIEVNEDVDFLSTIPNSSDYINCDKDVQCFGDLTENEIIETVHDNVEIIDDIENCEDEELDVIPSLREALNALNVIQKYSFYNNIDLSVYRIENKILKCSIKSIKQKTITEFFS